MVQGQGNNLTLSSDVETFNFAMWWFEPNSGQYQDMADIDMRVCRPNLTNCVIADSSSPQQRRVWKADAGGLDWVIRVSGDDIPPSSKLNYYPLQQRRKVYGLWFWEDSDRDDSDGPSAHIE